jgi:nucleoside-diphosphate-sugar epimerase
VRTADLRATGFVGRALVPALAQRGEVVAVSRRANVPDLPGVRSAAADLTDGPSTRGALEGVDDLAWSLDPKRPRKRVAVCRRFYGM